MFLEVISGPSAGLRISQHAKEKQSIVLTVGRIPQNDLVLNDPEVSGKHALISWNSKVNSSHLFSALNFSEECYELRRGVIFVIEKDELRFFSDFVSMGSLSHAHHANGFVRFQNGSWLTWAA